MVKSTLIKLQVGRVNSGNKKKTAPEQSKHEFLDDNNAEQNDISKNCKQQ